MNPAVAMPMRAPVSAIFPVKGTTKVVGIFGDPVTYTLSPQMHNFAFQSLGLDFVYVPFLVKSENLKSAVDAMRSLGIVGVNVTIPHKEAVIPYLDELTPIAKIIGAVNTILNNFGKLVGHNTDASGFMNSLREDGKFNPQDKRAVILGAGGTACALSVALLESGIKRLVIVNRSNERARALVAKLNKISSKLEVRAVPWRAEILKDELKNCDLFVNATPTGIDTPSLSFPAEKLILSQTFVFDCVYATVTPLLVAAQKAGASSLGGIGMLIRQGALSFSIWTGQAPPVELMRKALDVK